MKHFLTVAVAIGLVALTAHGDVVVSGKNITVTGADNVVSVTEAEQQFDIQEGASATMSKGEYPAVVHVDNSAITLTSSSWKDDVVLWLDASATNSLCYERINDDPAGDVKRVSFNDKSYPTINRWYDCRGNDQPYYAMNNRGLAYADDKTFKSVMPFVATNEVSGMPYVSFGNSAQFSRRITFYSSSDSKADTDPSKPSASVSCKFAFVVFGSQQGGGYSVLHRLARGGLVDGATTPTAAYPIFSENRTTYVDGVQVDPTQTGLNGEWQTIAFGGTAMSLQGLCMDIFSNYFGGGNYCEIILMSRVPTEGERGDIESYLAAKWGTAKPPATDREIRLFGTGSVAVSDGDFAIGGTFTGSLAVASGASVVLTDVKDAPGSPAAFDTEVESGKDAGIWYDTDMANTISRYSSRVSSVGYHYNLRESPFDNTQTYCLYGSSRTPKHEADVHGFGPLRTWFTYDYSFAESGCTLRLGAAETASGQVFDFKTGFMVLDTSAGGGTPFLGKSINASNDYLLRRVYSSTAVFNPGTSCPEFVKEAGVRLNGVSGAKPTQRKFNYRPEVLSVSFSEAFPLRCFGAYENTSADNMLIHGESLFYKRALSETERDDTEAYLMNKWLGLTPKGYGNPSGVIVSGSGTVALASRCEHPVFDIGFSGTVVLSDVIGFVVSTNASGETVVSDAMNVPSATIEAPAVVTVKIDMGELDSPRPDDYVLISADALPRSTTFVMDASSLSEKAAARLELVVIDDMLKLRASKPGLTIILR
ncbi:MAG: hypothetical protein IJG84_17465 [Kiritimatiellae bacterium]|nr:hypothetical protein [Kiritimatiellia bacterium]